MEEEFDLDKYLTLRKESIKTESEIEEKVRTETYVVINSLQNLRVRIDLEGWMIILGYYGMSRIFDLKTKKDYQFNVPDKNISIKTDFLKYLAKIYQENKIIKDIGKLIT